MDRLMQEFEQVIRHLEKDYVLLPIASAKQVTALLRAGVKMRNKIMETWEKLDESGETCALIFEQKELAQAWDAALEGE